MTDSELKKLQLNLQAPNLGNGEVNGACWSGIEGIQRKVVRGKVKDELGKTENKVGYLAELQEKRELEHARF